MKSNFTIPQFVRIIVILLVSFLATVYFPTVVFDEAATLTNPTIGLIMFVFVAGFLIGQAVIRNRELDLAVSYELSRLRRIVHLTEVMDAPKKWKDEIRERVVKYLKSVAEGDFKHYEESHGVFREVTHMLYEFKPKSDQSRLIFEELLAVTRDLSFQRQLVSTRLHSIVGPHVWIILVVILLVNVASLLASREPGFTSPLFIAASISGLLLVFDILFELNTLTRSDRRFYERKYLANSADLVREKKTYVSKASKK